MSTALAQRLEKIQRTGGIKARDVARLLNASPQTVSRWQNGKTEPRQEQLERLLVLEYVFERVSEYYPPEEARLWLFTPHRQLGGNTPAQVIRDGKHAEALAVLDQLQSGAYI